MEPAAQMRSKLYSQLGELPERERAISSRVLKSADCGDYLLETLVLDLNGIEEVPAYFAKPKTGGGRRPTVLFNHSHGGHYELGKEELIRGVRCLQDPPYAAELTRLGCNVLCVDHWCFGERSGMKESETFKEMLWNGQVLWGMMVYDSLRAVDYLVSREDVDADRLGTLGISMGSTMAWWLAALDTRVKVCVDICCLTEFQALVKQRGLDYHGVYYYVPGLLKRFTTAGINALIAPRPHLSLAGLYDVLTPPEGLDMIDAELQTVYAQAGAPDNWRLSRHRTGHQETAAMRCEILDFLSRKLDLQDRRENG
jgi:pimeloyl-ACP methyl ester carboxylesterase